VNYDGEGQCGARGRVREKEGVNMLDIFIDRLIQLLKTRQENKEKLFTDFVQPTYESFEKAHQKYIDCFQEYQRLLSTRTKLSNRAITELLERLKQDSLWEQHIRHSAILEAEELMESRRYNFSPFMNAIRNYFEEPISGNTKMVQSAIDASMLSNAPRVFLYNVLTMLQISMWDEKARKKVSKTGLDEIIKHIQGKRLIVQKEYLEAKKHLLQR
jgi:hypothetical protein